MTTDHYTLSALHRCPPAGSKHRHYRDALGTLAEYMSVEDVARAQRLHEICNATRALRSARRHGGRPSPLDRAINGRERAIDRLLWDRHRDDPIAYVGGFAARAARLGDARTLVIDFAGRSWTYSAASRARMSWETMYHQPMYASSNAAFSVAGGRPGYAELAQRLGRYLAGGSNQSHPRKVTRAEALATLARFKTEAKYHSFAAR